MIIRSLLLALLFAMIAINAFGQTHHCGTADRMIASPPSNSDLRLMKELRRSITEAPFHKNDSDLLVIPTVIHVIHFGNSGNISDAQVLDGLRVVNEDFQRLNADSLDTDPLFQPVAANVGMEFRLATIDPDGNPTTGIVRVDTNLIPHPEPVDPDFNNVKFVSHWPEDMYFNIWVTRGIQGGTLGYAQYPGTGFTYGGPWRTWGPVVRSNQWGTIGSSFADGRTATHEIGHCFGLYHTFLNTSAGCGAACDTTGDEVCDTPPCQVDFACAQINSCPNDTLGPSAFAVDSIDQIENYMSYNACQNMFSIGQKERMRGFYYLFDTISNLSLPANLAATGTVDAVSVQETVSAADDIRIFPNPTSGEFTITSNLVGNNAQYTVMDMLGRIVAQGRMAPHGTNVNLEGNPPGIYPVHIHFDGQTLVRRVLLQ